MSVDHELVISSFFNEWNDPHRIIQKAILADATDATLAAILLVTNDMLAIIQAEYDRRGAKST